MTTKLLILLAIPLIFYGCSKDTYTASPQISIKSISSSTLQTGDLLIMDINFTVKSGDVLDTLWVQKFSKTCPLAAGVQFTTNYTIPAFSNGGNQKGIMEIGFGYNANIQGYSTISGCGNKNDTAYFRFWVRDSNNNTSDTITTPNIVLLNQ